MTIVSESQIWNQIDEAERYLVRGVFDEAASLASSAIQTIRNSEFERPIGDTELADMMNSAGMVIVQSYKELGRTKQVFVKLNEIYGSIWAIPVQVFLTGASLQVAEGFGFELKQKMEEYLSKWEYMIDAGVYVLREDETEKSSSNPLENDHIRRYFLSCTFYLEVAELYTVKLLGMFLHRTDLAISWAEAANLPQDGHQALLRRLHSLQAMQKQQAAQRAAPGLTLPLSNDDSHETGNEKSAVSKGDKERQDFSWKLIQQSIQRGNDRLNPFCWWFRSMKIKIGRLQFVIPSGKLMLFFSLFFSMSFLLRKRGGVFKSLATKQMNSLKQAAFDALKLAFSVQMNPLAAVQLPRA